MTARVSAADQDYMRRLGEFMAEVNAEQLREHLSLTVNERLVRSERLAKRNGADAARAQQDDHAAFFRRARELGLCDA